MSAAVRPLPSVWAALVAAIGACWTTVVVLVVPPTPSARRRAATMPPPSRPERRGRRNCRMALTVPGPGKTELKRAFSLAEGRAERAQRLLGVRRAHEQLADQDGVDAHALEVLDHLTRDDSRLRDDGLSRRYVGQQLVGPLDVDAEVGEVAVVDADVVGVNLEGDLQLLLAVDLDEHIEVDGPRLLIQAREVPPLQRGDDQQEGVGAGRRGLEDLIGVDDEVLAKDRQAGRRTRLAQVGERAAEVVGLGEDRQRRGAAALVGADDIFDGRALADGARRGRTALVLGDDRDARARE